MMVKYIFYEIKYVDSDVLFQKEQIFFKNNFRSIEREN